MYRLIIAYLLLSTIFSFNLTEEQTQTIVEDFQLRKIYYSND